MKKFLLPAILSFCYLQFCTAQSGELDSSFGINGIVTADLGKNTFFSSKGIQVLLTPGGSKYVLCDTRTSLFNEHQTFVARVDNNGKLDVSYGKNGFSDPVNILATQAVLQPDGKIVVAGGYNTGDFVVFRFNNNGGLDTTFGNNGVQVTDFNGRTDYAWSIALQSDGKIVVAGSSNPGSSNDFAIARYKINGTPDSTFSGDGKQITDFAAGIDQASSVAVQPDGKIVVVGNTNNGSTTDFGIVRYKTNGSLDNTFSDDGKQVTNFGTDVSSAAAAVAIQKDGKIVVAGSSLVRYNKNGTLDSTFSYDGIQTTIYSDSGLNLTNSIALQNDGKIVVAGYTLNNSRADFALARYHADGSADTGFSGDGIQTTDFSTADDFAYSIAIQPDGKILMAGSDVSICGTDDCFGKFAVSRYSTNGTPDNTFNEDGKLTGGYPEDKITTYTNLAVQKDGKIVVCGSAKISSTAFAYLISRYNANGSPDSTFGNDGIQANDIKATSVAIQADGKIVVAGTIAGRVALARYNTDGSIDNTFSADGKLTTGLDYLDNYKNGVPFLIQKDNKIVGVSTKIIFDSDGFADHGALALLRYNTDGTPDNSFNYDGSNDDFLQDRGYPSSIGIRSDGKIAVGVTVEGFRHSVFFLAIFNAGGSLAAENHSTFFSLSDEVDQVSSLAIQSDDKIILEGSSDGFPALARYYKDGSLDNSFGEGGKQLVKPLNSAYSEAKLNGGQIFFDIQNDGKLVLVGYGGIIRCNANGSLDSTFSGDGIEERITGQINSIAIAGYKLYTAGYDLFSRITPGIVARYILDDNIQILPVVTLTSPARDTNFIVPGPIILSADATDKDGTIKSVDFYNDDSTLLFTDSIAPYSFQWYPVPTGSYHLTAVATDNKGGKDTSASVHVNIIHNRPPVVNITSPGDGAIFPASVTSVLFTADAHAQGSIRTVDFYNGTLLIRTERKAPYKWNLSDPSPGIYSITAKATDSYGRSTTSAPVTITVEAPGEPRVSNGRFSADIKSAINNFVSLKLAPNPVRNILNIYTSGLQKDKRSTIYIISSSGVTLQTKQLNNPMAIDPMAIRSDSYRITTAIQLNVSALVSGVYIIKLITGDEIIYRKFIKL